MLRMCPVALSWHKLGWEMPSDVWEMPYDVWEMSDDVWEMPGDVWENVLGECSDPHAGLQASMCSGYTTLVDTHIHRQADSF